MHVLLCYVDIHTYYYVLFIHRGVVALIFGKMILCGPAEKRNEALEASIDLLAN